MASLVVAGPLTDSVHAETRDRSRTLHSWVHAELSRGQFEATAGSARLSVTVGRSPTRARSEGGDIWIQRPAGRGGNAGLVHFGVICPRKRRGLPSPPLPLSLYLTYKHACPFLTASPLSPTHSLKNMLKLCTAYYTPKKRERVI